MFAIGSHESHVELIVVIDGKAVELKPVCEYISSCYEKQVGENQQIVYKKLGIELAKSQYSCSHTNCLRDT